ncbi:hypothetical protein TWF694_003885 [Orbilia ellipsospora]|uniref:Ankyrin n=1 Tax=Orbilia ellipsospora TaxID=2528407 RepID=A0AAV9WZK3_9PEZI
MKSIYEMPSHPGVFLTPLLTAINYGHLELVKALLAKEDDPTPTVLDGKERGSTALHIAASMPATGTEDDLIVDLILERFPKIDINTLNAKGHTGLRCALRYSPTNMRGVKVLLEKGVDLDIKNHNGNNILHTAVQMGNDEVCRLLLDYCQPKHFRERGVTREEVPSILMRHRRTKIVQAMIEKKIDMNSITETGSILLLAVADANLEIASILGKSGLVDINKPNESDGSHAQHYLFTDQYKELSAEDATEMMTLLFKTLGMSFDVRDHRGFSPIHVAANQNSLHFGTFLDFYGSHAQCDPDQATSCDTEYTPLHLASANGATDICKRLIEKGANVNKASALGDTALLLAVTYNHIRTVEFLLEHGADIAAKTNKGTTVWNCLDAIEVPEEGLREILQKYAE